MGVREAADRAGIFVQHDFAEQLVDLGEIRMNYAVHGDPQAPALVLVPAGTESWWSYEEAIRLLSERFQVFAVDQRGQGRSTWTPGRYSVDNFGNDLVRFLDLVVGRPAVVAGNSYGGVVAAWLAAFAKPGQVRGLVLEDAPLFACEVAPRYGPGLAQNVGPVFQTRSKWLGNQWSIGDWQGMIRALPREVPPPFVTGLGYGEQPPQSMREYDPEVDRSWITGQCFAACDHADMLAQVKVPVLVTHHFRMVDPETGLMIGAMSDLQADNVCRIVKDAGQPVTYTSLPDAQHVMHADQPERYAQIVTDWIDTLG